MTGVFMQSTDLRDEYESSPLDAASAAGEQETKRSIVAEEMIITGDDTVRLSLSERARDLAKEVAGSNDERLTVGEASTLSEPESAEADQSAEQALAVLAQSGVAELRFLRVDEDETQICLSGRVRSFYHKQLAQEAIRPIAAGRQLINRVDVTLG